MQATQIFFGTLIVLSSILVTQSIELYKITRNQAIVEKYYNKANECLMMKPPNGAVYISKIKDFECQPLLSEANCNRPGEWLVLTKHRMFAWIPKCVERKSCGTNRLAFGSRNGDCVNLGDPSKCEKDGEVVRGTLFGYGECSPLNYEGEFDDLVFDGSSDATDSFSALANVPSSSSNSRPVQASVTFGGWPGRR